MKIRLPKCDSRKPGSLESAIIQRETRREYLDTPLTIEKLSELLFAAQGMRGDGTKRVSPSAHEQYPIFTYLVSSRVAEVDHGIYQYDNVSHTISELNRGSFSTSLGNATLGEQPWVNNAPAIVVFAANIQSMNHHFADQPPINARGERYCYIEIGAIVQNMQLRGTALDIGMVLVGGFNNKEVKSILQLPHSLEPAALVCVANE